MDKGGNDMLEELEGASVAVEDCGAGDANGTEARSQFFWKLALVVIAVIWGSSFLVMKDTLDSVPTFLLLACRFLIAALILLLLFFKRIRTNLNRHYIGVGALMGVCMASAYALQTLGLADTTAGKNAFLTGVYCVLVPFISYFVMHEPLTRYNLGAAFLCLAGIALVALDSLAINMGDVLTLGGAVFFALQITTASKFGRSLDVNAVTFWMFLTVGVLCLTATLIFEPVPPVSIVTPRLVAVLLFLAVICTCVNMLIQNLGLAHVPSSTGSLLLSLESPSGVFFSVLLGGEVLTGRLLLGFALIFCSIVLSETHFSFLRRR